MAREDVWIHDVLEASRLVRRFTVLTLETTILTGNARSGSSHGADHLLHGSMFQSAFCVSYWLVGVSTALSA